jgi:hypothetical protein
MLSKFLKFGILVRNFLKLEKYLLKYDCSLDFIKTCNSLDQFNTIFLHQMKFPVICKYLDGLQYNSIPREPSDLVGCVRVNIGVFCGQQFATKERQQI